MPKKATVHGLVVLGGTLRGVGVFFSLSTLRRGMCCGRSVTKAFCAALTRRRCEQSRVREVHATANPARSGPVLSSKPVWTPSRIQQAGTLHSAAQSSYICKVSWRPETPDVEEGQFLGGYAELSRALLRLRQFSSGPERATVGFSGYLRGI